MDRRDRVLANDTFVVLFDACFSAGAAEPKRLPPERMDFKLGLGREHLAPLAEGKGRVIIASSDADEESLILPGADNSLFTHHLARRAPWPSRANGRHGRNIGCIHPRLRPGPEGGNQHPILKVSDTNRNFVVAIGALPPKKPLSKRAEHFPALTTKSLRETMTGKFTLAELEMLCSDVQDAAVRTSRPGVI